jgi:hypothetical protein
MSSVLVTSRRRPRHPCGCPVRAPSHEALELEQGAPPCTFRRHHKMNDADCPAGGSSPIVARPGPGGTRCGSCQAHAPGTAQAQWSRLLPGSIASKSVCRLARLTAALPKNEAHRARMPARRTRRARPTDTAVMPCDQSRSKPRLASSSRIASPVPGPKAG